MKWFRRAQHRREEEGWERIEDEVRRAKLFRFEQTVTQRDLVDAVSRILFRVDPVGINSRPTRMSTTPKRKPL